MYSVNKTLNRFAILLVFLILISSQPVCSDNNNEISGAPVYTYKILKTFPHDEQAFTQGLVFEAGVLYEGTGRYGKSELTKRMLETMEPVKRYKLPSRLFGEGITIYKNNIIQLTWRAGLGLVYDSTDFQLKGSFSYSTEGWGITHDRKHLIMSDGTDYLYFLDPDSFKEIRRIRVSDNKVPVTRMNELEYIKGKVYANVWKTGRIAIINPDSGQVEAWVDLEKLVMQTGGDNSIKTLNGIAYDEENDRIFVTGKLWPAMYEIRIVPAEP